MALPMRCSQSSAPDTSYPLHGVSAILPIVASKTDRKPFLVPSLTNASFTVLTDCGKPKEVEFARRRTFMVKEGSYSIACATFALGASGSRRRRIASVEALGREGIEGILAIISSLWLTAFFPEMYSLPAAARLRYARRDELSFPPHLTY